MAVTITSNKKDTSLVLHVAGANTTIKCVGNSSTTNVDSSNVCIAKGNEVLSGAYITQVFWGVDPAGYIVVKRGDSIAAVYDSTSYYDYAGSGMALTVGQASNLSVEFIGTSNGYVMLELQKVGTFNYSDDL